jgi:tetratricopeptide (TPR) repeat protein
MAPEQLEGASAEARTDTYALGVLMFELFAGRRPWKGTPTEVLGMKLSGGVPAMPASFPEDVAAIIRRCLSPDPSGRPADAGEVLRALDEDSKSRSALSFNQRRTRPELGSMRVAVRIPQVESAEDAYLATALASDIIRLLGSAPELEVHGAPLSSDKALASRYDACVEGTVRRVGMAIRLSLRVVSAADGYLVWARSSTFPLTEALAAIESNAGAIARALSATTPERRPILVTRDPKVLDLYLRARHADQATWHDVAVDDCALYEELLAHLPEDPLILAAYAKTLSHKGALVPASHSRARELAERALKLAPDLPEAHQALALVLLAGNDNEAAARAAMQAAELSPSLASAQSIIGSLLCEVGRTEAGLGRLELAQSLDPRLTIAWAVSVVVRARGGDREDATAALKRAPKSALPAVEWLYWLTRVRYALYLGGTLVEEAARDLQGSPFAHAPPLQVLTRLASRTVTSSELSLALSPFIAGEASLVRAKAMGLAVLAEAAAFLGDEETARSAIEGIDAQSSTDIDWLARCPLLETMRSKPWFDDVRGRIAARAARLDEVLQRLGVTAP